MNMELALSICLGIGLSAACGFRVFVPLLGISMAALAGHVVLVEELAWIGTWPALACFLTATILEIGAYYVPWIDNLLDSIATPAAVVAGTIVMASVVTEMSPQMRWTLALIAGGGAAGLIQTATVVLRGTSTATTGGTANWIVTTIELLASMGATIFAMFLPLVAAAGVVLVVLSALLIFLRRPHRAKLST
jgi:Domain of unknown function (DUF4126)